MTRASTRIVRYGSSGPVTRWSRSGSISSRAVARRIVPARCRTPSPSMYPLGNVKVYSVCSPAIEVSSRPDEQLVLHGALFDHQLIGRGVQIRSSDFARPHVGQVEAVDLFLDAVVDHDRTVLVRRLLFRFEDRVEPLHQVERLRETALERDVAVLGPTGHLRRRLHRALVLDGLELHHLELDVQSRTRGEPGDLE